MNITIEKPEIVTISYRQTKGDKDYGSCLWARFNFDLKHYSLTIESDCGDFSHGWVPTPDSETFLQLCARFNWEYLLNKISSRTVIDSEATLQKVKELMKQIDEDEFYAIGDEGMEEIESACTGHTEETSAYMAICDILVENGFSEYDSYDAACCIEKDYPAGAKTIARIYRDYIQPEVLKLAAAVLKGENENA